MQGAWVQSLAEELRSCMLQDMVNKQANEQKTRRTDEIKEINTEERRGEGGWQGLSLKKLCQFEIRKMEGASQRGLEGEASEAAQPGGCASLKPEEGSVLRRGDDMRQVL